MSAVKEKWIAAEAVSSRVGLPVVASPSGRLICNVNCVADPLHGKVAGDGAYNRDALANARLIAAAPEMVSALREAERYMIYFSGEDLTFVGPGMPAACLGMIRSTLAKAGAFEWEKPVTMSPELKAKMAETEFEKETVRLAYSTARDHVTDKTAVMELADDIQCLMMWAYRTSRKP